MAVIESVARIPSRCAAPNSSALVTPPKLSEVVSACPRRRFDEPSPGLVDHPCNNTCGAGVNARVSISRGKIDRWREPPGSWSVGH